ncbi:MAG: hypothetical protein WAW54_09465 [Parvibaculum sedimenti]|uniref:hypothetical protein n=1 Tax=Parvibaculum sedimenti TaxID=2608632 RepID=UPI003BB606BF
MKEKPMLHHISIPARDPAHVATVLAEILAGRAFPFLGPLPGAFSAVAGDEHGTLIEVYPQHMAINPDPKEGTSPFLALEAPAEKIAATPVAFHALISVPLSRAEIKAIGEREGWKTLYLGRGAPGRTPFFHVIEFWVENRIMLELATPDMLAPYLATMNIAALEQRFPHGIV